MTIVKSLRRFALCAVMALPFAAACTTIEEYDDSDLKEQIDLIINKIYELEQKMNSEIQALKDMLAGKIMITSISRDASTGITTVNLSNGSSFELLPEKDLKSYVTYITLSDGIDYWAYIDADGKKQLFLDEKGEAIPVIADVPEVIVKDDQTWIVIGGVEYPLSGNSVFSDYELITDELTGEVYAVTFTFGEGMSFTVTLEGACGFFFVKPSGWSTVAISDYYVANGLTERVQVDARGVVDYVLQIPDGWRVKEYEDIYMGAKYFDITAPAKELVESGVAAGEGDLKVVAVLEGGKATVAKLYLSTNPFKEFAVALGKADVKMYNGLQKFVYGVGDAMWFKEATAYEKAATLLDEYDYPSGYGVSDFDLEGISLSELAGQALTAGRKYVFWAIPAIYSSVPGEEGYYIKEGTMVKMEFKQASVKYEIGNESNRDAQLSMALSGVDAYYSYVLPKEEFLIEDVVYGLNVPGYYTTRTTPMTYEGSVFGFHSVEAQQATEYVAWFAVAEEGRAYTEKDVIVCEFATLDLAPGSPVKVEAGEVKEFPTDIEIPLTASGAEKIYYTYMKKNSAAKYESEEDKATYLFGNGVVTEGESVVAKASEAVEVNPASEYEFWAVASDADGKYSNVVVLSCASKEITYNDLVVSLVLAKNDPGNVIVNISAEGAEGFLYWIGKTTDNVWKSASYLGGSAAKAQQYMYTNSGSDRFTNIMAAYPVVDGRIVMTDLTPNKEYVIVAMAMDKDGLYSNAVDLKFTPRAVAIGDVVLSTDSKWENARPTVEMIQEKAQAAVGQMPGNFSCNVTIPENFTAYVLAGTDSYLTDGDMTLELSAEDKILKIIEYVDKSRDANVVVDYDLWGEKGYPYGFEFFRYKHGNPAAGNVVIWANEGFHASKCGCDGNTTSIITINGIEVEMKHVVLFNDGKPVEVRQPYAVGSTTEVIDKVFVVCQDLDGNCYEPFEFDVPVEYFRNAGSRD